jgi:hypothetical protein
MQSQPVSQQFIPLEYRDELKLNPTPDTLINEQEYHYEFVLKEGFKVDQVFFSHGLAIKADSLLIIIPNTKSKPGVEEAQINFVVSSSRSYRILMQQKFFIKTEPKVYPVYNRPKGFISLGGMVTLERNASYPDKIFKEGMVMRYYDTTNGADTELPVRNMIISLVNKKGQKYFTFKENTLNADLLKEFKKFKKPCRMYVRLEYTTPENRKRSAWTSFMVYDK